MLDIASHDLAWPEALKPLGEKSFDKETFEEWWARHSARLSHLEPRIAEQWVYRHWTHSPYCFLDLECLRWRLERWPAQQIIDDVHIHGWTLDPDHDYRSFNQFGETPTSRPMNRTGTWDYPIIILETKFGIRDRDEVWPDVRFLLIEGHCRLRYLNALMARDGAAAQHDLFVLTHV